MWVDFDKDDEEARGQSPEDSYLELNLLGVETTPLPNNVYALVLKSSRGDIKGLLHPCEGETGAIIWVGGALGGLDGPAGGIYAALAPELVTQGLTSLRLDYRYPGALQECVLDVLAGASFLKGIGASRLALVGHSFGGAVVIMAASLSPLVVAVVALSSQTYGAWPAPELSPRPLLLVHGLNDTRLSPDGSRRIYQWAKEPKDLVLYPGAGHRLQECREELLRLLKDWLVSKVGQRKVERPRR